MLTALAVVSVGIPTVNHQGYSFSYVSSLNGGDDVMGQNKCMGLVCNTKCRIPLVKSHLAIANDMKSLANVS
jgi:hypothetical protein